MLSTEAEEGKPDFCCAIMSRRFWTFSKGPKPIPDFREPFAGIWRAQKMFSRRSSRRETSRFHVYPAKLFISRPTESAATTMISFRCRMDVGALPSEMYPEKELAQPC